MSTLRGMGFMPSAKPSVGPEQSGCHGSARNGSTKTRRRGKESRPMASMSTTTSSTTISDNSIGLGASASNLISRSINLRASQSSSRSRPSRLSRGHVTVNTNRASLDSSLELTDRGKDVWDNFTSYTMDSSRTEESACTHPLQSNSRHSNSDSRGDEHEHLYAYGHGHGHGHSPTFTASRKLPSPSGEHSEDAEERICGVGGTGMLALNDSLSADETSFHRQSAPKSLSFRGKATRAGSPALTSSRPQLSKKQQLQQSYCNTVLITRTRAFGIVHRQTAQAFFDLGHACLRNGVFEEALQAFQSAHRIWSTLEGQHSLPVAKALDALTETHLRANQPDMAKSQIEKAFSIRLGQLGPWHVDVVESFNKLAGVTWHCGEPRIAAKQYEEVFAIRKAIFGTFHPSVAVTAQTLANIYMHLKKAKQAKALFDIAVKIYRKMGLPASHPTVDRLLKDRNRVREF